MTKVTVGIDIGGTNTTFGLVNAKGKVIGQGAIPTPKKNDAKGYVKYLSDEIKKLISNNDVDMQGIGIGAPNANFYTGNIEEAPNLAFKGVVPFVNLVKDNFSEIDNVAITNDANAAAMGEMIYGGAKGMKNFIMITLGTGLGSGIVVNGELMYGHDGFAGELGHITVIPEGRQCGCGQTGHLETYCSATGMVRTALDIMAHHNAVDSKLASIPFNKLTSKDIYEAAVKDDPIALEVFDVTGDILGQALADAAHICSPEAFFVFGGPTAAGDLIFKPTKQAMEDRLMPVFKDKIKILPSELNMGTAAIVGASALVAAK